MRETKRFLMDSISHYPDLKLEWLSIDDDTCVERVIWPSQLPKSPKPKKSKGKGKQKATVVPNGASSDAFPLLPMDAWDTAGDSDDDDEDDERVTLGCPSHFSDVWGVKIFKKEMMSGRL